MIKLKTNNPKVNGSGCKDLTAYEAIKNISKKDHEQDKKVNDLIKVLKLIIDFWDFDLIGRISIVDRKTGKEYR